MILLAENEIIKNKNEKIKMVLKDIEKIENEINMGKKKIEYEI